MLDAFLEQELDPVQFLVIFVSIVDSLARQPEGRIKELPVQFPTGQVDVILEEGILVERTLTRIVQTEHEVIAVNQAAYVVLHLETKETKITEEESALISLHFLQQNVVKGGEDRSHVVGLQVD